MNFAALTNLNGWSHMPFACYGPEGNRYLFYCRAEQEGRWKLWVSDETDLDRRVVTGLADDAVECSPTAWFDENGWHVSFVGSSENVFYLWTLAGPTLDELGSLTTITKTRAGCVRPDGTIWRADATDRIYCGEKLVKVPGLVYRVSYVPDEPNTLLMAGSTLQNGLHAYKINLVTDERTKLVCGSDSAYKCAILDGTLIWPRPLDGELEHRRLAI